MINPSLHIDDIPVIDLADGLAKDPAALADTVRHICHDVGLFVVTNHGVAKDVVDDAFRVGKALFSLPREQKLLIDKRLSPHFRGWEAEVPSIQTTNRISVSRLICGVNIRQEILR